MEDLTYSEIKELIHKHEKGLIDEIAKKHHMSVSEVKRILGELALKDYVEAVIEKAIGKPYKELPRLIRGELRLLALKLCMPIFWAVVRFIKDIPKLKELLEATPEFVYEKLKKLYRELLAEAREIE